MKREILPWKHRPFPELVRLAGPIAVSMLSYSVMTMVGTLFVGRLGAAALAGIGVGGVMAFNLLCFGIGLLRSVKVLVSQAVGAGRREQASFYVGAGLVIALGFGAIDIVAGRLGSGLLTWFVDGEDAAQMARSYLEVRVLAAPAALACVALRESRYGLGDASSPMRATVCANLLNIALDFLLVRRLGWGVAGAAWSTVAASAFELAWLLSTQRAVGPAIALGRRSVEAARAVWKLGVPIGVQFLLEVGAFSTLTAIVASLGKVQAGAHQIALQVIHVSFLPAFALGEAASVLAGQAVGAGEVRQVRKVARLALWAACGYTAFCGTVFAVGARVIAGTFGHEPELIAATTSLLYVAAVFQVFDGANVVARSLLRGTGDVKYAATVSVLTSWVCTPPLAWLLGRAAGLGALGGWLGICLEIIVGAAVLWLRLEKLGWLPAARRARQDMLRLRPDEAHAFAE
jgi:multidrug resistance protein, MATE family